MHSFEIFARFVFFFITLRAFFRNSRKVIFELCDASGKSEVTNFNVELLIEENIGRLDVSVHHSSRMQVVDASQHVVNELFDVCQLQHELRLDQISQVLFMVFHHDIYRVEIILIAEVITVDKLYNVRRVHFLKQADLPEDPLGVLRLFKNIAHDFDSDDLVSLGVLCCEHAAVAPRAEFLYNLVSRGKLQNLR
eukprot:CAMPEP_0168355540 /NCGR_PEP_ID=MMETSP0213-20121227/24621_1 /TAXON_ID=151035 /ORGANISM="Euplotes harpa, Strain FSP1.4" /LENGTH=193 /DNA_ID=CAMNT_0008367789 /DNA_START=966 /DNA_END=1544 /DNA_ORIENTATION=+